MHKYELTYCLDSDDNEEYLGSYPSLKAAMKAATDHHLSAVRVEPFPEWYQIKSYLEQDNYWWTTKVGTDNVPYYDIESVSLTQA